MPVPVGLGTALDAALGGNVPFLEAFLREHSNLPGPRGNLELAWRLADEVAALSGGARSAAAFRVVARLAAVGPEEAPTGDPGEFLAFCATVAAGGFAVDPARRPAVWRVIGAAAEDPRWRQREGAAQAIQRAIPLDPDALGVLGRWASDGSWLRCRAAAAGLADPTLLRDRDLAAAALRLHDVVITRFAAASDRRDPGFRVLRQGLGYTLSVVVSAAPDEGFGLMRRLAVAPDRDLAWVLRSNLGKGRLTRGYPAEVEALRRLVGG